MTEHAISLLREHGHKLTPQRMLIVSAFQSAKGHISAADILARVHEEYPYVDASTVYRTLGRSSRNSASSARPTWARATRSLSGSGRTGTTTSSAALRRHH